MKTCISYMLMHTVNRMAHKEAQLADPREVRVLHEVQADLGGQVHAEVKFTNHFYCDCTQNLECFTNNIFKLQNGPAFWYRGL